MEAWPGNDLCIGETLAQRRAGDALEVCANRLAAILPDMPAGAGTTIAYEPLRAIGPGPVPAQNDIVAVLAYVRAELEARFGTAARPIRILYGGSVDRGNAGAILDMPDVNGLLIGGASLLAADFNAILNVARVRVRTAGLGNF